MNTTMSNVSKLIRGSAFQHHGELPRPRSFKSRRSNVLYRRIQAAAKEVCGYPGADLLEQSVWKSCYHDAIADAIGKVNSPLLTAVDTGHPAAITAMLAK